MAEEEYEDYLSGDDDEDDDEIEGDEILAASKRRKKAKKVRKSHGIGNMYLKFGTAVTVVGAQNLNATAVRECRPVDLRIYSSVAGNSVVTDLQAHGVSLFNSPGGVATELLGPGTEASGPNCDVPEVIKGGETVVLSLTNLAAAANISAVLKCRSTTR